jgi:parallel beta-helix repeat protein
MSNRTRRSRGNRSLSGNGKRRFRRLLMATAATAGSIGLGVFGAALLAQPAGAVTATLTIASTGTDTGNCAASSCATLGYALSQAATGDTIMLAPGTYKTSADPTGTSNIVPVALTGLTIESDAALGGSAANTIIEGAAANGLAVNANGVTVNGLTFDNSGAAGIMMSPPSSAVAPAAVTGETIENNVMNNSDQCGLTPATTVCTAAIGAGDYGESIWMLSVTDSTVEGNTVENGLGGGILVSDEDGPNFGNTIENNTVLDNGVAFASCGITLAAHNSAAIYSSGPNAGQPDPAAGGVYNETVKDNTSDGNGATGIGVFNAAYNNTIEGNTFDNNGEPGVKLNPTFPGGDVNGNSIIGNTVGVNSLLDGPGGGIPGSHNSLSTQTTGIMVVAPAGPVTGTIIQGNTVAGNYYGVYLAPGASSSTVSGNTITVTKGGAAVFTAAAPGSAYWLASSNGGVFSFGQAPFEGSAGAIALSQPIVGEAAAPDGGGYWLAAKDGGIFSYGSATYWGSLPGENVHVSNIVGIAPTANGGGYWLVGSDGGVFAFGDAAYAGSLPGENVHVSDIVGIAPTADGGGYFLVGKDGGVFAFGDAVYAGSVPGDNVHVSNIEGIAPTADGGGYFLVGKDGGVFAFGDAVYAGSLPGLKIHVSNIVGIAANPAGAGYWLVGSDGGTFGFGSASFLGSLPGQNVHVSNIVGITVTP